MINIRRLAAIAAVVFLGLCLVTPDADARGSRGGGGGGHSSTRSSGSHAGSGSHSSARSFGASHGASSSHSSARSSGSRTGSTAHAPRSSPGSHAGGSRNSAVSTHRGASASPKAVPGVARDSHARIARSQHAKNDFKKQHPCPSTGRSSGACPGYVIDHVKPLKRGGADQPSNMQWQTTQAARQKDKTE